MQAKQKYDPDDNRRQQNFTDVIVEDFLIGAGGRSAGILWQISYFRRDNRFSLRGCNLFYVHDLNSLVAHITFPVHNSSSWGVPLVQGARVFITKVTLRCNCFFAIICMILDAA